MDDVRMEYILRQGNEEISARLGLQLEWVDAADVLLVAGELETENADAIIADLVEQITTVISTRIF